MTIPMTRFGRLFTVAASMAASMAAPMTASAHFPWMATNDEGHAILWFGEGLADRTYPMPDAVASAEVAHTAAKKPVAMKPVAMKPVESDTLIGRRSATPVEPSGELSTDVTYGLYHGTKLSYHVEHLAGRDPSGWPAEPRDGAAMQTVITPAKGGGISVRVFNGKEPLADAAVKLYDAEGEPRGEATTDDEGRVSFAAKELGTGLHAVTAGLTRESSGEYDGEPYTSTSNYLTATFVVPEDASPARAAAAEGPAAAIGKAALPGLPEELTSFGAAVLDGKLYAYGGHTGDAHSYSTEEQSGRLWCLDLAAGESGRWEKRSEGTKLQGLALVAHGDRLIRLGGFTAVNGPGEDHDLRSQHSVAAFDPATGQWSDLPPLPEPRSSFDAAVLGDRVYVFGGWKLAGDSGDSQWHRTAWSLDLSDADASWESLAETPARRRALAVAAHHGKLYLIGGMSAGDGPTTDVMVYDPANDSWAAGPSLPGEGMAGFGSSAFAAGGALYVSVYDGHVYRLAADGGRWESVGRLDAGRFFHRMLPVGEGELLILGGANMRSGKFTEILSVKPAGSSAGQ